MAEDAGKYPHKDIEATWQERWESSQAFRAPEHPAPGKKLYVLDMFPYPSGAGLHVGHVEGYTATDIYSRYKRMRGFEVLHPMGWDAFGLPAENYAIKTGIHPAKTTNDAIETFRRQIKNLGLSYDWDREIGAHTPEYYRWTQWFFLFLYNNGLAYKKKALVNWDPVDQTVLANEQVLPDGTAERSGAKVEKKELEQWFFKITDFADALIDDLETVDWPESTKIAQRNWIGRSEGAEIDFALAGSDQRVRVFTTRPDTLFGATYLVLAPEHPLLESLTERVTNWTEVEAYVRDAKNKSDIDRSAEGREKTGIELKGIAAINPATKKEIPVFVADYVLGTYGTGAIMAVPAHDERDYEFAKNFDIEVKQVVVPCSSDASNAPKEGLEEVKRDTLIVHLRDKSTGKFALLDWHGSLEGITTAIMGGIEPGQTPEEAALNEIREEAGLEAKIVGATKWITAARYFASHKNENRCAHAYGFIAEVDNLQGQKEVAAKEQALHTLAWVDEKDVITRLTPSHQKQVWNLLHNDDEAVVGSGYLMDSGQFDGMDSDEAKQAITDFVGGRMVKTYRLRDWLISRQRYWGAPIPVVYDPEGNPHPIPEEHLPWLLPTDVEFKPTGMSPLGQSQELRERTERIFGKGWRPEIDTMDTFVCSSWYYYRFADPHNAQAFASKEAIEEWLPVDLYVGGAEHTVLHLLYARFFTKALERYGYVRFSEPFSKLRHQGIILAEDGNKMSKSKGNVINPDEVVAEYGADTLRMYEMFMGPLEMQKPWNTKNISGIRRFLDKVWRLNKKVEDVAMESKTEQLLGQTIDKVADDIENLKFNTAISALMILSNHLADLEKIPRSAYVSMLQILHPFAPHITAELLTGLGVDLGHVEWPGHSIATNTHMPVTVIVQVNGKVRGTVELSPSATEEEALSAAKANEGVAKWLTGTEITKAVYVPGKIISFAVKQV